MLRYKICRHRLYTGCKGCKIIGVSGFRHKRRTRRFSVYEECAQLINRILREELFRTLSHLFSKFCDPAGGTTGFTSHWKTYTISPNCSSWSCISCAVGRSLGFFRKHDSRILLMPTPNCFTPSGVTSGFWRRWIRWRGVRLVGHTLSPENISRRLAAMHQTSHAAETLPSPSASPATLSGGMYINVPPMPRAGVPGRPWDVDRVVLAFTYASPKSQMYGLSVLSIYVKRHI